MKRALQAILIAGEEAKEDVLSGRKNITIREGYRDYTNGPVLIGCHLLNWATMKKITAVSHRTLDQVWPWQFNADGFETQTDMLNGLREFYSDIDWDSEVTVVEWK